MTVPNIFKSGQAVFAGTGSFNLNTLTNIQMNTGFKEHVENAAGQISPSYIARISQDAHVSAQTSELSVAIAGGMTGPLAFSGGGSGITSVTMYMTEAANLGTIGGSSTHFKTVITQGLALLKNLSCSQGAVAHGSVEIVPCYDGTNAPFGYTTGVSLPATPLVQEQFTLGPAEINGTTITGVKNMEIDFGFNIQKVSSDGDVYPTYVFVDSMKPRITLTLTDASNLNTFTLNGTAQGATASHFYLQKMSLGGVRVAAGTSAHIKVTVNASQGMYWVSDASLQQTTGECKLIGMPIVGSSAVLTIATGSAIT
jgi:hypothetical protein